MAIVAVITLTCNLPESSNPMGEAGSSRPLHLLNLLKSIPDIESRLRIFLLRPFEDFFVTLVVHSLVIARALSAMLCGTQPIMWAWSIKILTISGNYTKAKINMLNYNKNDNKGFTRSVVIQTCVLFELRWVSEYLARGR